MSVARRRGKSTVQAGLSADADILMALRGCRVAG